MTFQPWITEKLGGIGGYLIRVRAATVDPEYEVSYYAQFEVVEQHGEYGDGTALYMRKGAVSSSESTTNIDEAQVVFSGSVKWDGCSNAATDEWAQLHLCGPEHWAEFGKVIAAIPALALKAMGRESFG